MPTINRPGAFLTCESNSSPLYLTIWILWHTYHTLLFKSHFFLFLSGTILYYIILYFVFDYIRVYLLNNNIISKLANENSRVPALAVHNRVLLYVMSSTYCTLTTCSNRIEPGPNRINFFAFPLLYYQLTSLCVEVWIPRHWIIPHFYETNWADGNCK